MATTRDDIKRWFERGVQQGATHLIVVTDTFDWEDYPVYVSPEQDVREVEKEYNGPNMQRVTEVYNLAMDMETQLNEERAFNY